MRKLLPGRIAPPHIALALSLAALSLPASAAAQQRDSIPGVELGLLYETAAYQPSIVLMPFRGSAGGDAVVGQVESIVAQDLRFSDRFNVMDSIPPAFLVEETVDYALWDRLGVVWLLSGRVQGSGDGYTVTLELHDVVYRQQKDAGTFRIPDASDADFRMAVHRTSDEVVRWVFDEPGMAATRVAFQMLQNGVKELYVVDSDGENLRRLTNLSDVVMSPAWSPDGRRIAYTAAWEGRWQIYELDLAARRTRTIPLDVQGTIMTPAYHPDGRTLAFAVASQGGQRGIYTYDLGRDCCLNRVVQSSRDDLSPTFSPDGSMIAFNSNRLGDAVPQVYAVPTGGGDPDLISPYGFDQQGYYTSPDWSPEGDVVAFHGRVTRGGPFQILLARMGEQGRLTQLTSEGWNEDPSWAPDARHLVFRGERSWGKGLFVVDTVTGNVRTVLAGVDVDTPSWSPSLAAEGGPR